MQFTDNNCPEGQTNRQIADRYIIKRAILDAMCKGRTLNYRHGAEFGATEMHTMMHDIRQDLKGSTEWELKSAWDADQNGKRFKNYWVERKS